MAKRVKVEPYRLCYTCNTKNPDDPELVYCVNCGYRLRVSLRYGPSRKRINEALPESVAIPMCERGGL